MTQQDATGTAAPRMSGGTARRTRTVPHPSVEERQQRGRDARAAASRSALGHFEPAPDRPDPVDLLESQGADRIQGLLPIRYGRMMESPFAFFRGAALIMASDLSTGARTSLEAQLCGDAHIANFGAFGSPERRLVFDVNDFDETHPGPFEWDVKRLVTSVELVGRNNGYSDKQRRELATAAAQTYRRAMVGLAGLTNLSAWYAHIDVEDLAAQLRASGAKKAAKEITDAVARAQSRDSAQAFAKLTTPVDGRPRIVSQPPLIIPVGELVGDADRDQVIAEARRAFRAYRRSLQDDRRHLLETFQFVDMAHKVVGVGSVGTRCWIVLLSGRDDADPLFLQIKQAVPSVLERFTSPSRYSTPGQRVVEGQRRIQAASDIFLGWIRPNDADGHAYYVRQLRDWKLSSDLPAMSATAMRSLVGASAVALAHAHARSGDRVAIAAYLGASTKGANSFDRAMVAFAEAYAEQNDRDYQALRRAHQEGRIAASA